MSNEEKMKQADELIRTGNQEDVAKGLELLDEIEKGESAPEETNQPADVAPETTPEPTDIPEQTPVPETETPEEEQSRVEQEIADEKERQRILKIAYGEKEYEIPDDDGYLGRKDLDGLKKSAAHKEAHIRYLEEQDKLSRNKIAEYEQRLNELKEKTRVPDPVEVELTREEEENTKQVTKRPKKPERPDIGFDPAYWTPEEETLMKEYNQEKKQYDIDMDKYFDYLENRAPASDPKLKEVEALIEETKKQRAAEQAQLQEQTYWNEIEAFRNTHPEYKKYRGSIKDLHHEVDTWTTRLANAAGYSLPLSPTEAEVSQFEATKHQLASRYESGEQALVNLNVAPPDGYKEYYAIADLEAKKNELIDKQVLAPKANLHNAWIQVQDATGNLDSSISELEVEARKRGVNSVMSVLESQQANNATAIPSSSNQVISENSGVQGMAPEQIKQILSMSPTDLLANPDKKALFDEIVSSGKFG